MNKCDVKNRMNERDIGVFEAQHQIKKENLLNDLQSAMTIKELKPICYELILATIEPCYYEPHTTNEETMINEPSIDSVRESFNAAINFALKNPNYDGLVFLHMWNEGDWDSIAEEFPSFDLTTCKP